MYLSRNENRVLMESVSPNVYGCSHLRSPWHRIPPKPDKGRGTQKNEPRLCMPQGFPAGGLSLRNWVGVGEIETSSPLTP